MIVQIGLTGNIGSGKSTVATLLQGYGAALVDADALARRATEAPDVLAAIAAQLGADLVVHGQLDRQRTAALVFSDPEARGRLDAIVHPWVARARRERVRALLAQPDPPPVIVHDIPLLFEVGLEDAFDRIVVVAAPLEMRVARVAASRGLDRAEVCARDRAQLALEEKIRRADTVIDNSLDFEALERQLAGLWRELTADKNGDNDREKPAGLSRRPRSLP